ncbi:hypothetical protein B9Z55_017436 [Caenorhabditis nigoni]|uniref:Uncharacterized protein n=2 Tax=Caenorhabditis nigoni TaxID=1611254 RepID=A0A2G5T935_9PELO|nr:hypothetical protein B9Z55_017436 [Caenorhabditis nigoni]
MSVSPKNSNFKEKLMNLAVSNIVSNAISVGQRLNLFKKLSEISSEKDPVLPEKLAEAAGCKERYVREWCNCMACGEIIEVNEEEKFWIKEDNVETLANSGFEVLLNGMVGYLIEPMNQLIACFKKDGPHGLEYSQFTKFQEFMAGTNQSGKKEHIVTDLIKAIENGIIEKLESGAARVLDVGCGNGFHLSLLAEHYPKTDFIGLDISSDAMKQAKERKMTSGESFKNLKFLECDAAKIPDGWTNSFDLVLMFDACHDQCRPDLCLHEVLRVLKPDGILAMIEIRGTSNVYTDKTTLGNMATMMYGTSLFHCLPVGSNDANALCYGAMWGEKRAVDLLNKCGFREIRVVETPYFPINVLYCAKKNC